MRIGTTFHSKNPIVPLLTHEESKQVFQRAGLVGDFIRKTFFFTMAGKLHAQQKKGSHPAPSTHALFWQTDTIDNRYPLKQQMQNAFDVYDQAVVLRVGGKAIHVQCRVIETKGCPPQGAFNQLIVQGNTSTLDNNIHGIYPFMESYLKLQQAEPQRIPHARFVICNHYDHKIVDAKGETPYLPGNMNEWGFVFKKTLESLTHHYGKFQLMTAHSLGNMPVVAHLKHLKKGDTCLPETILLAQGPSSLCEVSKNIPFSWKPYPKGWWLLIGAILYALAKMTGWTIHLDKELLAHLASQQTSAKVNLMITGVKHDYFFPGKVSLVNSRLFTSHAFKKLQGRISLLTFDPHHSTLHRVAQHEATARCLQRIDMIRERLYVNGKCEHDFKKQDIPSQNPINSFTLLQGQTIADVVMQCAAR